MLDDPGFDGRNVDHLPPLRLPRRDALQALPTAGTAGRCMHLYRVGLLNQPQAVPRVSWLATR